VIVADANLVVYLFVTGPHTPESEAVLRRDPRWAVPLLWRSEIRNALVGLVRADSLAIEDAVGIMANAERLLAGTEYSVPSPQVLLFAHASGCSAYDCEYVVLAENLGIPLVTTDRAVLRAFPERAISPRAFLG
jgi:predicted nucleic acid-binding protein